jgi:Zn-dependent protease with chaperone function
MNAVGFAVALSLPAALVPHVLPLHRASPVTGAVVWMLALALRALVLVFLATLIFSQLAYWHPVEAALAWCWHEVLPDVPSWLGFAEDPVAHAAVAVPAVVLAIALAARAFRLVRDWAGLRQRLAAQAETGPAETTLIPDDDVLVAVTRLGRGRVLVSNRALEMMDPDELAAGVAHEVAHIRRRHRPVLLAASILATIARPLPGTRIAERELGFQLERDADAYVVDRLHDPLSLASAICKVAGASAPRAATSLGGSGVVTRRLAELLDGRGIRSKWVERGARTLALTLAALVVAVSVGGPAWALGSSGGGEHPAAAHECSHH